MTRTRCEVQDDLSLVTDRFGPCPECGIGDSKVLSGKTGVVFSMVCIDGHPWIYKFPKSKPKSPEKAVTENVQDLLALSHEVVRRVSYFIVGERRCDICAGVAHKDTCPIGKMERLLESMGHPVSFDGVREEEMAVKDGEGGCG